MVALLERFSSASNDSSREGGITRSVATQRVHCDQSMRHLALNETINLIMNRTRLEVQRA